MLRVFVFVALASFTFANTALPANWVANDYGVCTYPWVDTTAQPPYSGANSDPLIAEAVRSGSRGTTCNFNPGGVPLQGMSQLYLDHWVLAASQSLYNGRKQPEDWTGDDCPTNGYTEQEALSEAMCGAFCGVCVLVSGTEGTGVFMINEIADAGAVDQNGIGINIHIDGDHNSAIRNQGAVAKDVQFAFVSCPTEDGIYIRTWAWYSDAAVFHVVYNYRNRLVSVENRGSGTGANTNWVPLVRSWTNRWQWESYGCPACPDFQTGQGTIFRGSADELYDLRLTDIHGNQIICYNLGRTTQGDIVPCNDQSGNIQQFPMIPVAVTTGCTGENTINLSYYNGNLPTGNPVTDPSNPTPAASPSRSPAAASPSNSPSANAPASSSPSRTPSSGAAASDSSTRTPSASQTPSPGAPASSSRTPSPTQVDDASSFSSFSSTSFFTSFTSFTSNTFSSTESSSDGCTILPMLVCYILLGAFTVF